MRDLELQLRAYGSVLDAARPSVVDTVDALPLRARRSLIVGAAAALVIAIAASAIVFGVTRSASSHSPQVVTPPPTPAVTVPSTATTSTVPVRLIVTAIGDSVMLRARDALRRAIPGVAVDAVPSRQFGQAVTVIDDYTKMHALPVTVVVDLGTNGRTTRNGLDDIMRAAGNRRVYFVTIRVPRLWENEVNTTLRALPERWSNAHVIDWHDYANSHDDWFLQDGFHLTTAGQQAYAEFIASALRVPASSTRP